MHVRLVPIALTAVLFGGCSGVPFRPADLVPDFQRSGCEWTGVMISAVEFHPEHNKHCFETRRNESSPGKVLACSGDPVVAGEMQRLPFREGAGAAPTVVRFTCDPRGGDQSKAIGEVLRSDLLTLAEALSRSVDRADSLESHLACFQALPTLDATLMIIEERAPGHHDIKPLATAARETVEDLRLSHEVMLGGGGESSNPNQADPASALISKLAKAPPTAYLEVLKIWSKREEPWE